MNDPERIFVGVKIMITVIISQTVNYNSFKFTALVHLPIVIICSYAQYLRYEPNASNIFLRNAQIGFLGAV